MQIAAKMAFGEWVPPPSDSIMNTTVTLDKAGRVVIPKTLRDELHLEAGDSMALECEGQSVTLRPLRSAAPLKKVRGVWVFHGSRKIAAADTDRVLERFRADRDRENRGLDR